MRVFIAPYKMASESAKALAQSLGVLRVDGSKSFRRSDVIINWGNSNLNVTNVNVINYPACIARATNKQTTFNILSTMKVPTVEYTTDKHTATQWKDAGDIVMARKIINGSRGAGIEVVIPDNITMPDALLYTKFIKAHEYRVHVFNGSVIDLQKKKRRADGNANAFIRNHDNGWVFCKEDIVAPLKLYTTAIDAVAALGLHFGAVDILYKEANDSVAVLEINCAPGISESTLDSYVNTIRERYGL